MNRDGSSISEKAMQKVPPPVPHKKRKITGETTAPDTALGVPKEKLVSCEDLTRLPVLYDDIVLACVCERYGAGQYYTWAGPTLVACNPCHSVPHLYTPQLIHHHYSQVKSGVDHRDAHVYSVAGVALHHLTHHLGSINQAVLVSGESGAGKTESARYMLEYLTYIETELSASTRSPLKGVWKDKQPKDIQEKILASNPILEAFGNAATLRNHNSSRFGKLLRLQYGGKQLRGAEIDTYLLEKTRVTHQPHHERNYHIFYQVMAGIRAGLLPYLASKKNKTFDVLTGKVKASDLENFHATLNAFKQLEFPDAHQQQIFEVLGALLHLGNLRFVQERDKVNWRIDQSSKEQGEDVKAACDMLGVSEDRLAETLTIHTICVISGKKTNVFHKPLELESQCNQRRDALMQLIYHQLFLHIVQFINCKIGAHRSIWSNFIGILDVYGFETFERNSLEQLCINYANERLQQAFTLRYISTEHQVMKEEGFLDVDIPYTDNSGCVTALDSRVSVFAILNEECQLKREVRENEACERICKALQDTGVVSAPVSPTHTPGFVIRHYAAPVKYDAQGLLHKNKDEVPLEVWGLLGESSCDFVRTITDTCEATITETGRRTTRKITTLAKFKSSLDLLMKTLSMCDLHYVRCIKPSAGAVAGTVEPEYILHQLKACGVIETVRISQAGYPVRLSYEDFISRYGRIKEVGDKLSYSIAIAKSVLGSGGIENPCQTLCRFGHTQIFLSESALHELEKVRNEKRHNAATTLQKYWKRYRCLSQYKKVRNASRCIQEYVKTWITRRKYMRKRHACIILQKNVRRFLVYKHYQRLCNAILTIQKYFRGSIARRKYELLLQQSLHRPYSRQSLISMNSVGYYSLTASTSVYSLHPSLPDMSPCSGAYSDVGSGAMSGESLRAYLSPEHHRRLLETEESGIETDTESINGDVDRASRRARKLRRRAQLQELLGIRAKSRVNRIPSNESLTEVSSELQTKEVVGKLSERKKDVGLIKTLKTEPNQHLASNMSSKMAIYSSDEKLPEIQSKYKDIKDTHHKMRVATMRNLKEVSSILKGYTPSENLQMVLPKQNLSLFFKDGVLSYRRMPVVGIKFHTRHTCLPFSHHLPYHEQPHGLLDALR